MVAKIDNQGAEILVGKRSPIGQVKRVVAPLRCMEPLGKRSDGPPCGARTQILVDGEPRCLEHMSTNFTVLDLCNLFAEMNERIEALEAQVSDVS